MTEPAPESSPPVAAVAAIVAAVTGVALLVVGVVRLVDSIESAPSTTVPFVVSTVTVPPSTTLPATDGSSSTTDGSPVTTGAVSGDFVVVTDDTGTLSLEVPATWTDVSGLGWSFEGATVGLSVAASPDLGAWYNGWATPGVFVGVSTVSFDEFTPELTDFGGACRLAQAGGREYPGFTTVVEEWVECGDEGSEFVTALVWPSDYAWSGLIQLVTVDESSIALFDRLMTTLSHQR